MHKIISIIAFFLLSTFAAFADQGAVEINLGAFYSHKRIWRGALIWNAPTLMAGPSFTFFNHVTIAGPNLTFFHEIQKGNKVSLGASYFEDNEPNGPVVKFKSQEEDYKNTRSATIDTFIKYEYRYKWFFNTSIEYHKDVKRSEGSYSYIEFATNLIPFIGVGVGQGFGDRDNNQYVYGTGAVGGMTHTEYFVSYFKKELIWDGNLLLKYSHSKINKKTNIQADRIRGNGSQDQFTAGIFWKF
ncbi:MAG: hypothetical protein COW01_05000 [Bdellovibrionales bacterium CG12_big_fil_rev_8_21_14_0_65_38_15]|nr:MAG: hypothetical protein COW79_14280 [Bdellovibrionales bacterium CG22_combo_CG10-13_8_21_14_all_38_13]PIQ56242.1 MAG: hypothetical protein COW01_05000 [Bdellovibrionales bacterium CG12_big_fil_rev_8_21_14_0_65_38_15]PIR30386.1 MAG: hypothetical protein COV38_06445 [Bdellovibrionales bacterium CG11_big_fil_rev_8_21_14_0_20_38_13]